MTSVNMPTSEFVSSSRRLTKLPRSVQLKSFRVNLEAGRWIRIIGNMSAGANAMNLPRTVLPFLFAGLLATLAGCSSPTRGATAAAPPQEVEIVEVQQKDVPIYNEWIGTLDGFVNADIKAQVTGYLLEQDYQEGSFVTKGQLLFQIDPRPFQAALQQAKANLQRDEAHLANAEANLGRYVPLQ